MDRFVEGLPETVKTQARIFFRSYRHLSAVRDEVLELNTIAAQARAIRPLGNKPLMILSARSGKAAGIPEFIPMHEELKGLSTRSQRRIFDDADHFSIVANQDHGRYVVDAIRDVVEMCACCQPHQCCE